MEKEKGTKISLFGNIFVPETFFRDTALYPEEPILSISTGPHDSILP